MQKEDYIDQIKKIEFFKQQILQEYLKIGRTINTETIQRYIDQIETRTAILSQITVEEGSEFDTKQINQALFYLYNDLKILYEIIVEHKKNRYQTLKEELDFKLQSLETVANEYKTKANFEYLYSKIGDTILYNANNYTMDKLTSQAIIKAGTVTVKECDEIFGLIGGTNFNAEKVYFQLEKDNGNTLMFSPYLGNNSIKIPGARQEEYYTYESEEEKILSDFKLSIPELLADEDNEYFILGSKNCYTLYEPAISTKIKTKLNEEITIPTKTSYVEFYVYKASYITFSFSEQPTEKNFSGYEINAPEEIQRIAIKANDGMKFDFDTDGTIYANYTKGYVVNQDLFCEARQSKDFFVIERKLGKEITYNVIVKINDVNPDEINIDYIAIKQKSWDAS